MNLYPLRNKKFAHIYKINKSNVFDFHIKFFNSILNNKSK